MVLSASITVSQRRRAGRASRSRRDRHRHHGHLPAALRCLLDDSNPDNMTLTAQDVTQPADDSVTVNSNGSFTYTPNSGFTGSDSFTYDLTDGSLTSSPATVTINVNATNTAPTATALNYSVDENTSLSTDSTSGVLTGASDADGDPLLATLVSGPSDGTLQFNLDGSFTYTPNTNFYGTDSFQYEAFDGTTYSSPATVTLTVNEDVPSAVGDSYSVLSSGPTSVSAANGVLANDSDPDGTTLTATLLTQPSYGTVAFNSDGSFTYTPGSNFAGSDSFTYEAYNGLAYSTPATVSLTSGPVAPAQEYSVTHDTPLSVDASDGLLTGAYDADGDTLTAALASNPSDGTVTVNSDGSFTYTPTAHFVGTDSFTYTASDGTNISAPATVTIDVTDDVPVAGNGLYSTPEGTALSVNGANGVLASSYDDDGDPLTAQLATGPSNGTLQFGGDGGFTYTPNTGFFGTDSFTYTASDGVSTSAPATVTIGVDQVLSDNNNPDAVASGDFTGNGNLDFAVANASSNTVSVYLGDGAGNFTKQPDVSVGHDPVALVSGDFNGDGKADLAVVNQTDNTVSILLSNGSGGFTTSQVLSVGSTPTALAVGDFNNDGKLDLAVTSGGANTVSIFLGKGDGTFTAGSVISVGTDPDAVSAADLNGDGNVDLAVANKGSGNVSVLLGNGDGTFQTPVNYTVDSDPDAVAVGDFNEDGIPDLAVANGGSGTVSILTGNGDGTFGDSVDETVGSDPVALAVGNFSGNTTPQGDGNVPEVDLAVVNEGSNNVSILSSMGAAGLEEDATLTTIQAPRGIGMGDYLNNGQQQGVVAGGAAPNGVVALAMAGPAAAPAAAPATTAVAAATEDRGFGTIAIGTAKGDVTVEDGFPSELKLPNQKSAIKALALSPNGKALAVQVVAGNAKVITIWDVSGATAKQTSTVTSRDSIQSFAFSPGVENALVTVDSTGRVLAWDVSKNKATSTLLPGVVRSSGTAVVAATDSLIAVGTNSSTGGQSSVITMWLANGSRPKKDTIKLNARIQSMVFTPDNSKLLVGLNNGTAQIVNVTDFSKLSKGSSFAVAKNGPVVAAFDAKAEYIIAGDSMGNITAIKISTKKAKTTSIIKEGVITGIAVASDYQEVLAANPTKKIDPQDFSDLIPD